MNLYKWMLSSALVFFVAGCTSESSSGVESYGNKVYKRVLKKGTAASMECIVYLDGNRIVEEVFLDISDYSSQMKRRKIEQFGYESSFAFNLTANGIFQSEMEGYCENARMEFSKYNAHVDCSDTVIDASMTYMGADDPSVVQSTLDMALEIYKKDCDDLYESEKEAFAVFSGEWGGDAAGEGSGESVEKAVSCEVSMEGDSASMMLVYSDKSLLLQVSEVGGEWYTTESYTGLDESTLASVCDNRKSDPEDMNVMCAGSSISYYNTKDEDESLENIAVDMKKELCPAFLSGMAGFETILFL